MNDRPTRGSVAGRAYLDVQSLARRTGQTTQQLLQLYALEGFLARLAASLHAEQLVLKGGVLLAAYMTRRPTRDIDFLASRISNDAQDVLGLARTIASIPYEDGLVFDTASASAGIIREDDQYSGVRVQMVASFMKARINLGIDVNVGDPIWPAPLRISVPRLLGGSISLLGYPLAMVFAEKIITMVQRSTTNTRWRDFADVYALAGRHRVDGTELATALATVAAHREIAIVRLEELLEGYSGVANARWEAWFRKERIDHAPPEFGEVLSSVISFADPVLTGQAQGATWHPAARAWLN